MRDYVAEAIKRTRRAVGYPLKASPADVAELARVLTLLPETPRDPLLPLPLPHVSPNNIFGEVLDAAEKFAVASFGDGTAKDPLRFHLGARIVRDGFPVDTALDAPYYLRMRGREHDVLDADRFLELLRDPGALLRRMHPDYGKRLLLNAVDAIAECELGPDGPSPNARSMRTRRPAHMHAMSPSRRHSALTLSWRSVP